MGKSKEGAGVGEGGQNGDLADRENAEKEKHQPDVFGVEQQRMDR